MNILLNIFFHFRASRTSTHPFLLAQRTQSLRDFRHRHGCLFDLLAAILLLVPHHHHLWRDPLSVSWHRSLHSVLDWIFQFHPQSCHLRHDQSGFQGCFYWHSQEDLLSILLRRRQQCQGLESFKCRLCLDISFHMQQKC